MMKYLLFYIALLFSNYIPCQDLLGLDFQSNFFQKWEEFTDTNTWDNNDRLYNVANPRVYYYRAKKNMTNKAVVICPGGGFRFLAINQEGNELAEKLSNNGINAFVFYYRTQQISKTKLNEKYEVQREKLLLQATEDLHHVIVHLRKNSEKYNINTDKIGLIGFSAGGSLAIETTLNSKNFNKPNYLATIYSGRWTSKVKKSPSNTPLFVSCAKDDPLDLYEVSIELSELWKSSGEEVELLIYDEGGHGYGMNKRGLAVDGWSDELINWILNL